MHAMLALTLNPDNPLSQLMGFKNVFCSRSKGYCIFGHIAAEDYTIHN